MLLPSPVPTVLLVATLTTLILGVDVILGVPLGGRLVFQYCLNLPPGQCCCAVFPSNFAEFRHLNILDFATIWESRSPHDYYIGQCSGRANDVRWGPGTVRMHPQWQVQLPMWQPQDYRVTGASYISLPLEPPAGDDAPAPLLTAEGLLGFVWGGGKWFSGRARAIGLGVAGVGSTGLRKAKREPGGENPGVGWEKVAGADNGTVYWERPAKWRWKYPNVIEVNEKAFRLSMNGSGTEYRDVEGAILDLRELGG